MIVEWLDQSCVALAKQDYGLTKKEVAIVWGQ